jgi:5'-3' exonuclease
MMYIFIYVGEPGWCLTHCTQAPGEAEAELAELNSRGIIDAVLTKDSDTLVFGAQYVIRR